MEFESCVCVHVLVVCMRYGSGKLMAVLQVEYHNMHPSLVTQSLRSNTNWIWILVYENLPSPIKIHVYILHGIPACLT